MVIHDLSHHWTDITYVWICSKHLRFGSQVHSSFRFLHSSVFPNCSYFFTLAPYPHGDTIALVFYIPYDNIYDISESIQPHIGSGKVLHQIGRKICDPHHNFSTIQGIDCAVGCLNFILFGKEYAHIYFLFQLCFHIIV